MSLPDCTPPRPAAHTASRRDLAGPTVRLLPAGLSALAGHTPPPWTDLARCAETDPEAFFPEKGESTRAAKAVCARCPVRAACLDDALARNDHHGVWGGLSPRERRGVRRELHTATARRAS